MENNKSLEVFAKAPIRKAVLQNALPAMAAMLMVLIYNLADTFFIGQTHDDLQVAAVSLATPVFLLFMSVGTVFGIGGTSVISRALGEGRKDYSRPAHLLFRYRGFSPPAPTSPVRRFHSSFCPAQSLRPEESRWTHQTRGRCG